MNVYCILAVFVLLKKEGGETKRINFYEESYLKDVDPACKKSAEFPTDVCKDWIQKAGSVEMNCQFQLRLGMWQESMAESGNATHHFLERLGPALLLRHGNQTTTLEPHSIEMMREFDHSIAPIICEHKDRNPFIPSTALSGEESSLILLMVANSVEYLFRFWPFFVHKVLWADSLAFRIAIWIGELPVGIAETFTDECRASKVLQSAIRQAHDAISSDQQRRYLMRAAYYDARHDVKSSFINSNHHIKMLATYATLRYLSPKVSGLFSEGGNPWFPSGSLYLPRSFPAPYFLVSFPFFPPVPYPTSLGSLSFPSSSFPSFLHLALPVPSSFPFPFPTQFLMASPFFLQGYTDRDDD
mmetsp:Transcript_19040/g.28777  ORF Transcript_19040/g.28777 Transcript_19040/m.28777 type:complete len:357 (+) Transcript_19040:46-1116(+)